MDGISALGMFNLEAHQLVVGLLVDYEEIKVSAVLVDSKKESRTLVVRHRSA